MLFRYFRQLAGTGKFRIHRALDEEALPFYERKLKDGTPKYEEVTFADWWAAMPEDEKADRLKDVPEGTFSGLAVEEGVILCLLTTGEPADESDLTGEQPEGTIVTTDAPEGAEAPEGEQTPPDAPSEATESASPEAAV